MVLKAETKQLLDRNRSAVPEAVRARNSQAMRLQLPNKTITLVNASGKATEAGKYFYQKIRRQPIPDSKFDDDAVTYRKDGGRTDFVRLRNGAEVRNWAGFSTRKIRCATRIKSPTPKIVQTSGGARRGAQIHGERWRRRCRR